MARDTLALADHLGLDSFHLLGFSMGGAISQELALMAPERVRTLQPRRDLGHVAASGSAPAARILWVGPPSTDAASRSPRTC